MKLPDPMKREQRFCFCGWSIYGNEMERRNGFASHRQSDEHQKRIDKAHSNIDALVEAELERRGETP